MRIFASVFFVLVTLSSCATKYYEYNADWIISDFTIAGKDTTSMIGMYNFKIDVDNKEIIPMGLYLPDKPYMLREKVDILFSQEGKQDFIDISDHPVLSGRFNIDCLDDNCCSVTIQNDLIYLLLIYNGDIPIGKTRSCP